MNVTKCQPTTPLYRGLCAKKKNTLTGTGDKDRGNLSENTLVKSGRLLDRPPSTAALAAVSLKGTQKYTSQVGLRQRHAVSAIPSTPGANVQNRLTGKNLFLQTRTFQSNANRIS